MPPSYQRLEGRLPVGVRDFEYDVADKALPTAPMGIPPDQHAVGSVFYPCQEQKGARQANWMPSFLYAEGFAAFAFMYSRSSFKGIGRVALRNMAWWMGGAKLPCFRDVPPVADLQRAPLVVLSHGMGGNRFCSSLLCSHLASQGFVVMALEHTDGSASTAKMAGQRKPLFFAGWLSDEERPQQIRHRMQECCTALRLAAALSGGESLSGLSVSGPEGVSCFRGRIDPQCAALVGHSYGALTVGALTAEDPSFACGVAIDPWWGGLEPEAPAGTAWATSSPLLIMSSHAWAQPSPRNGKIMSEGNGRVLAAAAKRQGNAQAQGPGGVLLVVEGSSHDTCIDVRTIYGSKYSFVIKPLLGRHANVAGARQLDAQEGLEITASCAAHFLVHHLPLTAGQRAWLASCSQPSSEQPQQAHAEASPRSVHPTHLSTGEQPQQQQQASDESGEDVAQPRQSGLDLQSSSNSGSDRTRAHKVCAEDVEALRQVARGRVFILESSPQMQPVPAAAVSAVQ